MVRMSLHLIKRSERTVARIPCLAALEDQPTPIVVDPHFKCPINAKIIENYKRGIGKAPILLTFEGAKCTPKLIELEKSGVRIFAALTSSDEGVCVSLSNPVRANSCRT